MAALVSIGAFATGALAHDHHDGESEIPEGETVSLEPLVGGIQADGGSWG